MSESLALVALLAAPLVMLLAATRLRKKREHALDERGVERPKSSTTKPWDKGMRNALLLACSGALLVIAGLYAWSVAVHGRIAPLFGIPVVAGVVILSTAYRTWMRAVGEIPEPPET